MSTSSYSKASALRRFGLRERLLLSLLLGAFGTVLVAVVGWVSFQRVVDSQAAIVSETLPASDALNDTVRGNVRLAVLAPRLARADSLDELAQLRDVLDKELPQIRNRLAAVESPHVEPELRLRLQQSGAALSEQLDAMADTIAERLEIRHQRATIARDLLLKIDMLEDIARIQSDNATAFLVATLTAILYREELSGAPSGMHERARDTLLDLDIDTLERMHELDLAVHALGALVYRLDELDTLTKLAVARQHFEAQLALLSRRLRDIPDPGSRAQAFELHSALNASLAPEGAFSLRGQEIELLQRSGALQLQVGELTTDLDALAGELIHRGGRILASAMLAADRSATPGFIAFGIVAAALLLITATVIVHVIRRQTLGRVLALENATLALAAGQRDVQIDTSGDDELGSLSRALEHFRQDAIERDHLAEALRLERKNLEAQVAERTTELRETNTALTHEMIEHAAARASAEKADLAKTAFLGTVSHELRTPISGMLGLLELLQPTLASSTQQHHVEQIRSAATLLLELLEDMLDFARIEAGGVYVEKQAFNLQWAVNDVFAVQGTRAAARGLALASDVDPAIPVTLVGDRPKLSQILLNLVGNAIKFSDEGVVQLRIAPIDSPTHLRFSVTDHGIGIDPTRQSDIFEPFVQVRDQGRHHAGTGLGLAVCKRLVQAMGGRIDLESSPGKGTTVSFELDFEPAPGGELTPKKVAVAPLSPGHRVLVVEDDDVNRLVVERFLELLNQVPLISDSVESALNVVRDTDVAIAVVDMNLPDGDGLTLLSKLRDTTRFGRAPAILISAHLSRQEIQSMLDAGFDAVLPKPFSREQLGIALARLLDPTRKVPLSPRETTSSVVADDDSAYLDMSEDPSPTSANWVDLAFLSAERDALGMATLSEIATVFERQGGDLIESLINAAQADDLEGCTKLAHKLRGAASNLGLSRLMRQAADLEACRDRDMRCTPLVDRVDTLSANYTRTVSELKGALRMLAASVG